MATRRRKQRADRTAKRLWTCFVLTPLAILLSLWIWAALHFLVFEIDELEGAASRGSSSKRDADPPAQPHRQITDPYSSPTLLSRHPKVAITSSARGNLGPPSVLNQDPPGTDWIKDRWQAASDMGGTAIPGSHWVVLDFTGLVHDDGNGGKGRDGGAVYVTKVVLDWEAAYAKDYRIEGRMTPPPPPNAGNSLQKGGDDSKWCVLYDGALDDGATEKETVNPHRSVEEYGQSPGVKQKMPLHIIHTIDWSASKKDRNRQSKDSENCHALRYLRVFVRKPARGWGVSLWEVDVFGTMLNG